MHDELIQEIKGASFGSKDKGGGGEKERAKGGRAGHRGPERSLM